MPEDPVPGTREWVKVHVWGRVALTCAVCGAAVCLDAMGIVSLPGADESPWHAAWGAPVAIGGGWLWWKFEFGDRKQSGEQ
jgi:hypothetical protein